MRISAIGTARGSPRIYASRMMPNRHSLTLRICEVEGEKSPQNSGGPIQVTSLKEAYGGNGKIVLTVTIAHVGNGDFILCI